MILELKIIPIGSASGRHQVHEIRKSYQEHDLDKGYIAYNIIFTEYEKVGCEIWGFCS